MCKINEDALLAVMQVSKCIYKTNESNHKIKRISLLLSSVLLFIYLRKRASSLDMYSLIPYAVGSQLNILNTLIDLGYIYRHPKKENKSSIYSITELGVKIVNSSDRIGINKNYTPNKYKRNTVSSLSLS